MGKELKNDKKRRLLVFIDKYPMIHPPMPKGWTKTLIRTNYLNFNKNDNKEL